MIGRDLESHHLHVELKANVIRVSSYHTPLFPSAESLPITRNFKSRALSPHQELRTVIMHVR